MTTLIESPDISLWCIFISFVIWKKGTGLNLTFGGLAKEHRKKNLYHILILKIINQWNKVVNMLRTGSIRFECNILRLLGSTQMWWHEDTQLWPLDTDPPPRPCSFHPLLYSTLLVLIHVNTSSPIFKLHPQHGPSRARRGAHHHCGWSWEKVAGEEAFSDLGNGFGENRAKKFLVLFICQWY